MRQSILILLDWLLCMFPGSAGVSEAVVSGVMLVLLWRGEGVEVTLHVALGLGVEFGLERRQLLGHAEETSNFYTKNHPDYVCGEKKQMSTYQSVIQTHFLILVALVCVTSCRCNQWYILMTFLDTLCE